MRQQNTDALRAAQVKGIAAQSAQDAESLLAKLLGQLMDPSNSVTTLAVQDVLALGWLTDGPIRNPYLFGNPAVGARVLALAAPVGRRSAMLDAIIDRVRWHRPAGYRGC